MLKKYCGHCGNTKTSGYDDEPIEEQEIQKARQDLKQLRSALKNLMGMADFHEEEFDTLPPSKWSMGRAGINYISTLNKEVKKVKENMEKHLAYG